MKTITIISGERGSGKTTKAKSIIGNSNFVNVFEEDLHSNFVFKDVTEKTEYILIDSISSKTNLIDLFSFFNRSKLTINKPKQKSIKINMPNIIITLQN